MLQKQKPSKTIWNLLGSIPSMIKKIKKPSFSQRENTPFQSISHLIWLLLSSSHHSCSNCCNPQPWNSNIILLGCTCFFEQFAPRYPLAFLEIASEFCSMNLTSRVCAWHVQPKAPKDLTSSKCLVFVPESLNSRIRKRFNHVTCADFYLHPVIHVCWKPTIPPAMVESRQMSWSMSSVEDAWLLSLFSIGEMFSFPISPAFAMARCCHCLPCNQGLHLCATPPVVYLGDKPNGSCNIYFHDLSLKHLDLYTFWQLEAVATCNIPKCWHADSLNVWWWEYSSKTWRDLMHV